MPAGQNPCPAVLPVISGCRFMCNGAFCRTVQAVNSLYTQTPVSEPGKGYPSIRSVAVQAASFRATVNSGVSIRQAVCPIPGVWNYAPEEAMPAMSTGSIHTLTACSMNANPCPAHAIAFRKLAGGRHIKCPHSGESHHRGSFSLSSLPLCSHVLERRRRTLTVSADCLLCRPGSASCQADGLRLCTAVP